MRYLQFRSSSLSYFRMIREHPFWPVNMWFYHFSPDTPLWVRFVVIAAALVGGVLGAMVLDYISPFLLSAPWLINVLGGAGVLLLIICLGISIRNVFKS